MDHRKAMTVRRQAWRITLAGIAASALAAFGEAFEVERRTLAYKELLGWSGIAAVTVGCRITCTRPSPSTTSRRSRAT